jgi:hypothetical protein
LPIEFVVAKFNVEIARKQDKKGNKYNKYNKYISFE